MIPAAMFRTCVSYELKLVGFRASSPSYKNEMDVNLWFLFLWFPDRPRDGIFMVLVFVLKCYRYGFERVAIHDVPDCSLVRVSLLLFHTLLGLMLCFAIAMIGSRFSRHSSHFFCPVMAQELGFPTLFASSLRALFFIFGHFSGLLQVLNSQNKKNGQVAADHNVFLCSPMLMKLVFLLW